MMTWTAPNAEPSGMKMMASLWTMAVPPPWSFSGPPQSSQRKFPEKLINATSKTNIKKWYLPHKNIPGQHQGSL